MSRNVWLWHFYISLILRYGHGHFCSCLISCTNSLRPSKIFVILNIKFQFSCHMCISEPILLTYLFFMFHAHHHIMKFTAVIKESKHTGDEWLRYSGSHAYFMLTRWYIHAPANKAIFGSDNGLLPVRCQSIIWPSAGLLLMVPLGTSFCEI